MVQKLELKFLDDERQGAINALHKLLHALTEPSIHHIQQARKEYEQHRSGMSELVELCREPEDPASVKKPPIGF